MNLFDTCPKRHSRKVYATPDRGEWQRGEDEELGIVVLGDGRPQIRTRCRACGKTSSPLPHALITAWDLNLSDFTWDRINPPAEYAPCSVRGCERKPTEYHHFAPCNTFGREADDWPVMPLCREHHVDWHQRMTGYEWHRPGDKKASEPARVTRLTADDIFRSVGMEVEHGESGAR